LDDEKSMHFITLDLYENEVNEIEENTNKYSHKLGYLKETLSKVREREVI
jgi:hypothetical protein